MSKTSQIYQRVTENIISKLENAGSWQKLWEAPTPVSLNGHHYRGINYLLLSSDEYAIPVYGTFNQIRKNGGRVKKGEKSTIIVYWDKIIDKDPDSDAKEVKFFLKYYNVFNVAQAEFDEIGQARIDELAKTASQKDHVPSMKAEEIIANMPDKPAIIHDKSNQASYNRILDRVRLPEMKWFATSDEYYAALFHELIHSTGHSSRLDRFSVYKNFNDDHLTNYSREELVAELGASYLSTIAGLNHNVDNSAAYIAGWAKALKENISWIVWASRRAEIASDFILNVKSGKEVAA